MLPGLIDERFEHVKLPDPDTFERRIVLPDDGETDAEVLARIAKIGHKNKDDTKISGAIYADEDKWRQLVGAIYAQSAWLNPTHNSIWPELTQMEAEVYAMCSELFGLPGNGNGVLTSGGTMSNIQAMYAYRNKAYVERYVTNPNIVAPRSAHTSFKKACEILKIEYRMCGLDENGQCNLYDLISMVDRNTVCIVGSAPSFSYGIIDPLEQMAQYAESRGIGFHIDCCLGGFQYPFLDDDGATGDVGAGAGAGAGAGTGAGMTTISSKSSHIDFRTPGVTSISMDPHKFGQTPKGISVLLFRNAQIKKYLTFVDLKWDGGAYVMEGFPGSRPGANVCILWAMMRKMGKNGYRRSAQNLIRKREELQRAIETELAGDIYVFGNPRLSTLGIKSDKHNIHHINKVMTSYGWEFNGLPDGMHFCLTEKHNFAGFVTGFVSDLRNAINHVITHPDEDPGSMAKIYCTTQEIPECAESILDEIGRAYIMIQNMLKPESLDGNDGGDDGDDGDDDNDGKSEVDDKGGAVDDDVEDEVQVEDLD